MIKAILALLMFLSASPSNRVESVTAYHNGRAVHYYTAYSNGECIADDVANIQTLAELLTAPHGVVFEDVDEITNKLKG